MAWVAMQAEGLSLTECEAEEAYGVMIKVLLE